MRLLFNDDFTKILASLIVSIISAVSLRASSIIKQRREDKKARAKNEEELNTLKKSSLRGEYLAIFNSREFSIEEKYKMTRQIYHDYKALSGNHYMDELDMKLVGMYLTNKRQSKGQHDEKE